MSKKKKRGVLGVCQPTRGASQKVMREPSGVWNSICIGRHTANDMRARVFADRARGAMAARNLRTGSDGYSAMGWSTSAALGTGFARSGNQSESLTSTSSTVVYGSCSRRMA